MGAVGPGGRAQQSIPRVIVKLIAFVAVCTLLTGYLAFTIGNIRLFQHTIALRATFDDANGLLRDDNVKLAGVVVGKVTAVQIDQGRARVSFTVKDSVKVPADSAVTIRWRNLIGQRYLYVYPGTASTVLRGGDRITRTRSVVDVGELFNRLGPIIKAVDPKEVNTFLDSIVQALDGNQDKIRQAIDNLAVVAQSLGSRDQAIGR
ncbi:MAG: virulence factor Mce family protein, partial [Acidimicrobiales bacterium]|nr:virulence factor Mce family protein [Acidimicrobiales bacterium]